VVDRDRRARHFGLAQARLPASPPQPRPLRTTVVGHGPLTLLTGPTAGPEHARVRLGHGHLLEPDPALERAVPAEHERPRGVHHDNFLLLGQYPTAADDQAQKRDGFRWHWDRGGRPRPRPGHGHGHGQAGVPARQLAVLDVLVRVRHRPGIRSGLGRGIERRA